jgi:hypothetical protein
LRDQFQTEDIPQDILLESIDSGAPGCIRKQTESAGKQCNILIGLERGTRRARLNMFLASLTSGMLDMTRGFAVGWAGELRSSAALLTVQFGGRSGDVYNMLWALVFGFATLNILSLVTRRFEPNRNRMSAGELMAVMTVVVSVLLLGFEMLGLFHVLPLRLPLH